MLSPQKQQVIDLLKSIETDGGQVLQSINPQKYMQHNLTPVDDFQEMNTLLQPLSSSPVSVNTIRIFQDGPYVFAHTNYQFGGPKVGFDIFRFEDGQIVEHWDNLQETALHPNSSGHTMIDGPTDSQDLDKTDCNKLLVHHFIMDMMVNGEIEKRARYFNGDAYIQHNPQIGDGISGFDQAIGDWARQGIELKFDKIHQILGEGNFVLVISEGMLGGAHTSFYDLFRVEQDKIAEHWDTLETIPPSDT